MFPINGTFPNVAVIQNRSTFALEFKHLLYRCIGQTEPELELKSYCGCLCKYLGWNTKSWVVWMLWWSHSFFLILLLYCGWHAWLNLFLQVYLCSLLWQTRTIYRKDSKHITCVLEVEVGSVTIDIKPGVNYGFRAASWQFGKYYLKCFT